MAWKLLASEDGVKPEFESLNFSHIKQMSKTHVYVLFVTSLVFIAYTLVCLVDTKQSSSCHFLIQTLQHPDGFAEAQV